MTEDTAITSFERIIDALLPDQLQEALKPLSLERQAALCFGLSPSLKDKILNQTNRSFATPLREQFKRRSLPPLEQVAGAQQRFFHQLNKILDESELGQQAPPGLGRMLFTAQRERAIALVSQKQTPLHYWMEERQHLLPNGIGGYIQEMRLRYREHTLPYIRRHPFLHPDLKQTFSITFAHGLFLREDIAAGHPFRKAIVLAHGIGHLIYAQFGHHWLEHIRRRHEGRIRRELLRATNLLYPNILEVKTQCPKDLIGFLTTPEELMAELNAFRLGFPEIAREATPHLFEFLEAHDSQVRAKKQPHLPLDKEPEKSYPLAAEEYLKESEEVTAVELSKEAPTPPPSESMAKPEEDQDELHALFDSSITADKFHVFLNGHPANPWKIDDRGFRTLLRKIPKPLLLVALKGIPQSHRTMIWQSVFNNMSQWAAQKLEKELAATREQQEEDVQAAYNVIFKLISRLERFGELTVTATYTTET
ncbi:FliG C-terminal domain-containing protein [Magnetococcales bacterium HHB-1]